MGIPVIPVQAADNDVLSSEEALLRLKQIADSYDLYEPLSEKDAEFIRTYAKPASAKDGEVGTLGKKTWNFDRTKYNSNRSVGLWMKGSVYSDIGIVNNSFGGSYNSYVIAGSSRAYQIQHTIRHTAYGAIGSGGTYIGKVYDGSITNTCKKNGIITCSTNDSKSYVASVAYSSTWVTSKVWYDSGSTLSVSTAE